MPDRDDKKQKAERSHGRETSGMPEYSPMFDTNEREICSG
jgi:hypothetical protein